MTNKHIKLKQGLASVKKAIEVRAQITELYKQYHSLSSAAGFSAGIKHFDFKRAVDALYYLGGGWPSPNSKGRMEALLDNFVGMYRILDFVGRGHLVQKHLANYGMTVTLDPKFAIENVELTVNDRIALNREYNVSAFGVENPKDLRDLVSQLIEACQMLQGDICKLADTIKDGYKPSAQKSLGVTDEEYDRLHEIVKFSQRGTSKSAEKVYAKKAKTAESISNYNNALGLVPTS
jgi:hypothetical protein